MFPLTIAPKVFILKIGQNLSNVTVASRCNARPLASTASLSPSISLSCFLTTSTARGSKPRQTTCFFLFLFKAAKLCKILEAPEMHFSSSGKRKIILPERKIHLWAPKISHNFASLKSKTKK